MSLSPAQTKIMRLLKRRAMSSEELVKQSGLSYDGIRGRLSELRTVHHIIIVKKDGLYSHGKTRRPKIDRTPSGRILLYIAEKNLSGKPITPEALHLALGLSDEDLYAGLSDLCRSGQLTQLSKNSIVIGDRGR